MLAGISDEYYTRLEWGNTSGASDEVLEGIARTLQLDEAERGAASPEDLEVAVQSIAAALSAVRGRRST